LDVSLRNGSVATGTAEGGGIGGGSWDSWDSGGRGGGGEWPGILGWLAAGHERDRSRPNVRHERWTRGPGVARADGMDPDDAAESGDGRHAGDDQAAVRAAAG
jgi:hypothetical protein